jgi:hypothetical protein
MADSGSPPRNPLDKAVTREELLTVINYIISTEAELAHAIIHALDGDRLAVQSRLQSHVKDIQKLHDFFAKLVEEAQAESSNGGS